MGIARTKCSACGTPIEMRVADAFAGAKMAAPLCGAVLRLRTEPNGSRFRLGKIMHTITPGAVEALDEGSQHAIEFVARHVRGDWGTFGRCDETQLSKDERQRGWEATDDSAKINKSNLLNRRDCLMSEYKTSQGRDDGCG